MENKYYTPEIEEFHVGFEFEVNLEVDINKIPQWISHITTIQDLSNIKRPNTLLSANIRIMSLLEEGRIRVKYLDKEDIESLGFKHFQDNIYEKYSRLHISNNYPGWRIIEISKDFGEHKFEIRCANPSSKFGGFYGIIKNKSELRILLKQLNILT